MTFTSVAFLLFFPIAVVGYFLLPHRFRWLWLLVSSYYFYMSWKPEYGLILMGITAVDFAAGLLLERTQDDRLRRLLLIASICANMGVLFIFKYFDFVATNIGVVLHAVGVSATVPLLSLLLPIGISFHTFQSVSYVVEVYRRKFPAEKHFGIYALYVCFFPQLVAGPIERPQHLLPQFHVPHQLKAENVRSGLELMFWGFFKKLVIADRLGVLVDAVYAKPAEAHGPLIAAAIIAFAYQLYCDFSGYTDIALGAARIMGFELTPNFNLPYAATSITDFWRRWHISLSSWLRDYVYYPLVRAVKHPHVPWICFSLFITFLLCGLWHGAAWNYVVWGAVNGVYLVIGVLTKSVRGRAAKLLHLGRVPRLHAALQNLWTLVLVFLSLVFFRAPTLATAGMIFRGLLLGWGDFRALVDQLTTQNMVLAIMGLLILGGVQYIQSRGGVRYLSGFRFFAYRKAFSYVLAPLFLTAVVVYIFISISTRTAYSPFIYSAF